MNILFITHNSSRAGAPYVLLLFLKWMRINHPEIVCDVVDMNAGVMRADFEKYANNYFVLDDFKQRKPSRIKRLWNKIFNGKNYTAQDLLIYTLQSKNYHLIFANTVKTIPLGNAILRNISGAKLIVHVHELRTAIQLLLPNIQEYKSSISHYIAASNLVKNSLVKNWGIEHTSISRVYEFSEVNSSVETAHKNHDRFVVGGAGKIDWRKGYDIFIQVARYVIKHHKELPISFVWVGRVDALERLIIDADLRKLGLANRVRFVGEQQEPLPYFQEFDIFLMPSREDPFPLVCIEMAQLQKPLVCFENAVGTAEILKEGGGKIVPYLDIEAMANEVVFYYNNRARLAKDGERARALFSEFTPDKGCPKLYEVIAHVANDAV